MPNRSVPWYLWCAALAVTSAYIGGYWDISWHRSIGRDSFWTPPHVAIYACGVLAGLSSAYLIFSTTFSRHSPFREVSVRIWGLSGPLGAFISAWGGVTMLVSAPFDNWWHTAYGLDVRIVSPPHTVLALGFFGIQTGTVLLLLAFMNRADAAVRPALQRLFLYVGAVAICEALLFRLEFINRSEMHSGLFYLVVMIGMPAVLIAAAVASGRRWACTEMTAIYMAFGVAFLWILPLFPAEPRLAPVVQQVTFFIPWEFPLLLVAPAFVADLILQRTHSWRPLTRGGVVGLAFLATFILVQWPFASFLMTPSARNAIFGAHYMDFSTPVTSAYARFVFVAPEPPRMFWLSMGAAVLESCVMAWLGLRLGGLLRRVQR